jgi:hypothetical protein
MNRLLIPAAVAALVVGCARPAVTGSESYSAEPYYAPPETTVIVREVHYQEPVVYVDTVYMAEEPAPVQPVYVTEEYNEYNEYNHTDVYVRQSVPPPRYQKPGWSPRDRGQQPRDRRRDDGSTGDRNRPPEPDRPKVVNPKPPVKKINVPVTNDRQKSPVPPVPPGQPPPPKRQAPAQNGNASAAQIENEAPKYVPTAPVVKPATTESDAAQVQVGMIQTGTGLHAVRGK